MDYLIDFASEVKRRDLRIGFFGLGTTNDALMRELFSLGCRNFVLRDERNAPPIPRDIPFAALRLGSSAFDLADEDVIFLSPSVRRDREGIRSLSLGGAVLCSDLELFCKRRDCMETYPKLGVTGSDGKSTTTFIASRILSESGIDAPAIGNIGVPFCQRRSGGFVAELSSFQLFYASPELDAAALTSLTPNHLNWHTSFSEYCEAKKSIFKNAARAVISAEESELYRELSGRMPVTLVSVLHSFSDLSTMAPADRIFTFERGRLMRGGVPFMCEDELLRREKHNIFNMLCATALVDNIASPNAVRTALSTFSGLAHRCERFLFRDGISFIDSSIDTTPARTLTTLAAMPSGVRIILGGTGKGVSYAALAEPLSGIAGRVAIYGCDREIISEQIGARLAEAGVPMGVHESFADAVEFAIDGLADGDTLLLSPAATAYGEFPDYTVRGKKFKDIILSRYGKKE